MAEPITGSRLFRHCYMVETLEGGESPTDIAVTYKPLMATVAVWVGVCLYALS